jgi:hypothetical protein
MIKKSIATFTVAAGIGLAALLGSADANAAPPPKPIGIERIDKDCVPGEYDVLTTTGQTLHLECKVKPVKSGRRAPREPLCGTGPDPEDKDDVCVPGAIAGMVNADPVDGRCRTEGAVCIDGKDAVRADGLVTRVTRLEGRVDGLEKGRDSTLRILEGLAEGVSGNRGSIAILSDLYVSLSGKMPDISERGQFFIRASEARCDDEIQELQSLHSDYLSANQRVGGSMTRFTQYIADSTHSLGVPKVPEPTFVNPKGNPLITLYNKHALAENTLSDVEDRLGMFLIKSVELPEEVTPGTALELIKAGRVTGKIQGISFDEEEFATVVRTYDVAVQRARETATAYNAAMAIYAKPLAGLDGLKVTVQPADKDDVGADVLADLVQDRRTVVSSTPRFDTIKLRTIVEKHREKLTEVLGTIARYNAFVAEVEKYGCDTPSTGVDVGVAAGPVFYRDGTVGGKITLDATFMPKGLPIGFGPFVDIYTGQGPTDVTEGREVHGPMDRAYTDTTHFVPLATPGLVLKSYFTERLHLMAKIGAGILRKDTSRTTDINGDSRRTTDSKVIGSLDIGAGLGYDIVKGDAFRLGLGVDGNYNTELGPSGTIGVRASWRALIK